MKKNVLAVSIAAMIGGLGFAGVASAGTAYYNAATPATVAIDGKTAAGPYFPVADTLVPTTTGIGHILVVPYYSTQEGNVSLLNIVNTDLVNGKAVKLRYRGAANSDDVFDITVLMSPGDVWSANVSQADGVSTLVTNDKTCTLPANVNAAFSGGRANNDNAQTLEGYIEILNMADIPALLATDESGAPSAIANPLYTAIKHVNGVAKCETIASQLLDVVDPAVAATPIVDAATATGSLNRNEWNGRGYNFPSGGLMANWTIVNLSKAGSFTGAATAIAAVDAANPNERAVANLVFSPQDSALQPSDVASIGAFTHPAFLTADPLLAGGTKEDGTVILPKIPASLYDFPDLSTPYVTDPTVQGNALAQAETLSAALATKSITNEYLTSADVGFATDWTFSMPARRYNVAYNYEGTSATKDRALYAAVLDYADNTATAGGATIAPTVIDTTLPAAQQKGTYFTTANTTVSTLKTQVCVKPGALAYYDTEETGAAGGSYVISPQPIGAALAFCGEVSVLGFNGTSALGAKIATQNITTKQNASKTFTDGWMSIKTPGNSNQGLPVIGHAFSKALGSSFNLGGIWAHRTDRSGL